MIRIVFIGAVNFFEFIEKIIKIIKVFYSSLDKPSLSRSLERIRKNVPFEGGTVLVRYAEPGMLVWNVF